MTDSREPFEELDTLIERMNRQFEELSRTFEPDSAATADIRVDVADTGDTLVVTADLPGVDREEIDLRADRDTLTLRASPPEATAAEDAHYHRRERRQESASRRLSLPTPVDATAASATHSDGVLTVTLPKLDPESPSGYHIEVA